MKHIFNLSFVLFIGATALQAMERNRNSPKKEPVIYYKTLCTQTEKMSTYHFLKKYLTTEQRNSPKILEYSSDPSLKNVWVNIILQIGKKKEAEKSKKIFLLTVEAKLEKEHKLMTISRNIKQRKALEALLKLELYRRSGLPTDEKPLPTITTKGQELILKHMLRQEEKIKNQKKEITLLSGLVLDLSKKVTTLETKISNLEQSSV